MGGKVGFCGMKKAPIQRVGLMSGFQPRGILRVCGRAENQVWLIFALRKSKGGIPRPAGRGSGRCPENPQPFEKGWRKLQLGVRWFGQKNQFTWEHASGELTFMR